ncbi:hypothetical protein [Caballeronia novacaledonica]|uniref:Uncharacterized protein n=1 Tax=Caballeronia novacaledonica TaxID=1544861 RepID=A0AA37I586_9BURK|nr:hypothetical protein [Caballeronia novacaledonica]GJH23342.1 hypothetical protein CBA19CS42_02520 [Caballeronia novacaledonica]
MKSMGYMQIRHDPVLARQNEKAAGTKVRAAFAAISPVAGVRQRRNA